MERVDGIRQIDGGAIGHINGKKLAGNVCDQSIDSGMGEKAFRRLPGNDLHPFAVDLFGMVAGFRSGKFLRNDSVMVGSKIPKGEFAVS